MSDIPSQKETLRAKCLAVRQTLDVDFRNIASRAVIAHVLSLVPEKTVIAGYSAIRGELDIVTLMKILAERNHSLCLPDIQDNALIFRQWKPDEALKRGAQGTQVPEETAPEIPPEVLLVPLVAFDERGYRLGYGAGYYDRAIGNLRHKNKDLLAIGMAFSCQLVPAIPAEAHDEKLDAIVTENGIIHPL